MRTMLFILFTGFLALQYKLWLGDGNLLQWKKLKQELVVHQQENQELLARNQRLEADILELKRGEQALEEQARVELGMVKKGEEYYQFID